MCGIAGLIGETDLRLGDRIVRRMLRRLERRGPDSEGVEQWPLATLGHRRLSIFDRTDAGLQPMVSEDLSIAVVFNGAIFNFRDLRRILIGEGCKFRSETDTEILLHGYRVWGLDELVRRLRGMFAFGLWDNCKERLFLIRDRLGVKPLLYVQGRGRIAFASTAPALVQGGFSSQLNELALVEYLKNGYVSDDAVIYDGMVKLPAASGAEFGPRQGLIREWRYWSPPEVAADALAPSLNEAVADTEHILLDAVRLRLRADVPVGALLSGGIDSALVCWAVTQSSGNVTAFTVATPGEPDDEAADAGRTARELGMPHEIIEMTPHRESPVADLVEAYGEPFGCASALGMMQVSAAVRRRATVLLTGDGGDDLFLGYPEHRHLWFAEGIAARVPSLVWQSWIQARRHLSETRLFTASLRRPVHFIDYCAGGLGAVTSAGGGVARYGTILSPHLHALSAELARVPWMPSSGRSVLSDFIRFDHHTRFTGEFLTKVDGGSMFHGLEARSPFLDHELWNYASRLPIGLRLSGGSLKAILRALARRRISSRLASGRKRGFSVPVTRWLTTRWQNDVSETFHNPSIALRGWVNLDSLQSAWKRAVVQRRAPVQLWYLYVLEHWLRAHGA